jgi:hypothetical protein
VSWHVRQALLISERNKVVSQASVITIVGLSIALMDIVMRKERGIRPWAKATGLPASFSVKTISFQVKQTDVYQRAIAQQTTHLED